MAIGAALLTPALSCQRRGGLSLDYGHLLTYSPVTRSPPGETLKKLSQRLWHDALHRVDGSGVHPEIGKLILYIKEKTPM
jgi:hypothetical protein